MLSFSSDQPSQLPSKSGNKNSAAPLQGTNLRFSEQVLRKLADDVDLVPILRSGLVKAEIKGLNDAVGDYKRDSHRGKHAEEEVWPQLGPKLEELGFIFDFHKQQGRFFNGGRYPWPIRLLYARAQELDGQLIVWRKGECAQELFNSNKSQLALFPPVLRGAKVQAEPLEGLIWNIWMVPVIERVKIEGNLYDEELVLHMVYPLSTKRCPGPVARYHLLCDARLEVFRESLGQPPIILDLPEEKTVDFPVIEERDLGDQGSQASA